MFDFEKLTIYKKAKLFNSQIRSFINSTPLDRTTKDQLRRASLSIVLNIAEGSGRFSNPDRRNFYVIARSSAFECVAILDVLKDEEVLNQIFLDKYVEEYTDRSNPDRIIPSKTWMSENFGKVSFLESSQPLACDYL